MARVDLSGGYGRHLFPKLEVNGYKSIFKMQLMRDRPGKGHGGSPHELEEPKLRITEVAGA